MSTTVQRLWLSCASGTFNLAVGRNSPSFNSGTCGAVSLADCGLVDCVFFDCKLADCAALVNCALGNCAAQGRLRISRTHRHGNQHNSLINFAAFHSSKDLLHRCAGTDRKRPRLRIDNFCCGVDAHRPVKRGGDIFGTHGIRSRERPLRIALSIN